MAKTEFDAYENEYTETVQRSIDFQSEPHEYFLVRKNTELLSLLRGTAPLRRFLSVGSGAGLSEELLAPLIAPANLFAIEPSVPLAARSGKALRGNVAGAVAQKLPFRTGTFDVVYAMCVFHHIPPTMRSDAASEMVRVTRPGGIVCIFEHNPLNPLTRKAVHDCVFDRDAVLLAAGESRRLLEAAGASSPAVRFILFFPRILSALRPLEALLRWCPLGAQYGCYARR